MHVLGLDTTTRAGSVAILSDGVVRVSHAGDAEQSHAERLPGDILRALDAAGLRPADIDVWAVAPGPGSFTGLRIGIAAVQGFAFVTGARVVAVSALEALAVSAAHDFGPGTLVGAWMDAHRGDVFSALYRVRDGSGVEEVEAASAEKPASVLARWRQDEVPAAVIGDGALLYQSLAPAASVLGSPDLAPIIARVAHERARAGQTVGAAGIQPLYVRRPDVEIAREAKGG